MPTPVVAGNSFSRILQSVLASTGMALSGDAIEWLEARQLENQKVYGTIELAEARESAHRLAAVLHQQGVPQVVTADIINRLRSFFCPLPPICY